MLKMNMLKLMLVSLSVSGVLAQNAHAQAKVNVSDDNKCLNLEALMAEVKAADQKTTDPSSHQAIRLDATNFEVLGANPQFPTQMAVEISEFKTHKPTEVFRPNILAVLLGGQSNTVRIEDYSIKQIGCKAVAFGSGSNLSVFSIKKGPSGSMILTSNYGYTKIVLRQIDSNHIEIINEDATTFSCRDASNFPLVRKTRVLSWGKAGVEGVKASPHLDQIFQEAVIKAADGSGCSKGTKQTESDHRGNKPAQGDGSGTGSGGADGEKPNAKSAI